MQITTGRAGARPLEAERSPPTTKGPIGGSRSTSGVKSRTASSMTLRVEILVQGQLDNSWAEWFDGFTVEPAAGGKSVLRGVLPDQSALHGALARVRDLGLPLLGVATSPDSIVSSLKK